MKPILAAILAAIALAGCTHHHPASQALPTVPAGCHAQANGQLPDPTCTPGALNPAVTQTTIHQTICVPGYTATIRPPTSYTTPLKRALIAAYGNTDLNPRDYELDHLISLELGGEPKAVANLWPEPAPSPNAKDAVEGRLRREVCAGSISLSDAQREISTDWRTAQ